MYHSQTMNHQISERFITPPPITIEVAVGEGLETTVVVNNDDFMFVGGMFGANKDNHEGNHGEVEEFIVIVNRLITTPTVHYWH